MTYFEEWANVALLPTALVSVLAAAQVLYDAKDMSLACELEVPVRVPLGFHGAWIDEALLEDEVTESARARSY